MFNDDDIVFRYTSEQAEEDGILFNVTRIKAVNKNGLYNYVTTNLLQECGYMGKDDQINIPNILDLLIQCDCIIRKASINSPLLDDLYTGKIELPNGQKQEIYIGINETGKFTIMLPEDY